MPLRRISLPQLAPVFHRIGTNGLERKFNPQEFVTLCFERIRRQKREATVFLMMMICFKKTLIQDIICKENLQMNMFLLFSGLQKAAPDACVHTSVCLESDVDMPANVMEAAIEFMSSQDRTNKPVEETGPVFLESMQLNTAQRNMVEKCTRGQQSNDEWATQRCGRITALKLHDVHTKINSIIQKRGKKKIHYSSLVAQIVESNNISHLPAIKWGVAHENDAVKSFIAIVGSQHE